MNDIAPRPAEKKPFYKQRWFIIIAVLLVLAGIGKACGLENKTANQNPALTAASTSDKAKEQAKAEEEKKKAEIEAKQKADLEKIDINKGHQECEKILARKIKGSNIKIDWNTEKRTVVERTANDDPKLSSYMYILEAKGINTVDNDTSYVIVKCGVYYEGGLKDTFVDGAKTSLDILPKHEWDDWGK